MLSDEGTFCLSVTSRMASNCNYSLMLEQFFERIDPISIERRFIGVGRDLPDHQIVYCCAKGQDQMVHELRERADERLYPYLDDTGRRYRRLTVMRPCLSYSNSRLFFEWRGIIPADGMCWRYTREALEERLAAGSIVLDESGKPYEKAYFDKALGKKVGSAWDNGGGEPWQAVSERNMMRLIDMFSNAGDQLLCPFERDGVFSLRANGSRRAWTSVYTPFNERRSAIPKIPRSDYEVLSGADIELLGEGKDDATYSHTIRSASEALSIAHENESMSKELESVRKQLDALQKSVGVIREKLGIERGEAGVEETIGAILGEVVNCVEAFRNSVHSKHLVDMGIADGVTRLSPSARISPVGESRPALRRFSHADPAACDRTIG